jgi:hypothetical protein
MRDAFLRLRGFNKRAVFLKQGQGVADAPSASGVLGYMGALACYLIEEGAGVSLNFNSIDKRTDSVYS